MVVDIDSIEQDDHLATVYLVLPTMHRAPGMATARGPPFEVYLISYVARSYPQPDGSVYARRIPLGTPERLCGFFEDRPIYVPVKEGSREQALLDKWLGKRDLLNMADLPHGLILERARAESLYREGVGGCGLAEGYVRSRAVQHEEDERRAMQDEAEPAGSSLKLVGLLRRVFLGE